MTLYSATLFVSYAENILHILHQQPPTPSPPSASTYCWFNVKLGAFQLQSVNMRCEYLTRKSLQPTMNYIQTSTVTHQPCRCTCSNKCEWQYFSILESLRSRFVMWCQERRYRLKSWVFKFRQKMWLCTTKSCVTLQDKLCLSWSLMHYKHTVMIIMRVMRWETHTYTLVGVTICS